MIRAVFTKGLIQPIDPLSADWPEGQQLKVEPAAPAPPNQEDEIDRWRGELEAIIAEMPDDPEDSRRLQGVLAEAHRIAKEQVRREMELGE